MGVIKGKCKKNMILKAWQSFSKNVKGLTIAPNGCFSVYVGAQRKRFVLKTKFINHPLFMMLLDEAEVEYEFQNDGPILLPCKVELFNKVLAEINNGTRRSLINNAIRSIRIRIMVISIDYCNLFCKFALCC